MYLAVVEMVPLCAFILAVACFIDDMIARRRRQRMAILFRRQHQHENHRSPSVDIISCQQQHKLVGACSAQVICKVMLLGESCKGMYKLIVEIGA